MAMPTVDCCHPEASEQLPDRATGQSQFRSHVIPSNNPNAKPRLYDDVVWVRNVESETAPKEWFKCIVVEIQRDPISKESEYRLETKDVKESFQNGKWFPKERLFDEGDRNLFCTTQSFIVVSSMSLIKEIDVEKLAGSSTSSTATSPTVIDTERLGCAIPTVIDRTINEGQATVSKDACQDGKSWFRKCFPQREVRPVKVRSLCDFPEGYPNLAIFKSSDENFAVYRKFGYLHARVLLDKQDQLRVLEQQLDQVDDADALCHTRKNFPNRPNQYQAREEILSKVEEVYTSYASVFHAGQKMLAGNRPTSAEVCSVENYLRNTKPLVEPEQEYIQHREDLVTLRPGRDHAWLDRFIETCLRTLQGPLPFIQKIFASKVTQMKASRKEQVYYTRGRIDICASIVIVLVIIALLIVPIYLLYRLVSVSGDSNRVLDKDGTATCVGILLIFTLLFSAVLSVFTRAKRHEILGAAAAYCAVLVVFLGNVPAQ